MLYVIYLINLKTFERNIETLIVEDKLVQASELLEQYSNDTYENYQLFSSKDPI